MVEDLRRRQRDGELSTELDPAYLQVLLFAATLAPNVLPQVVRRLTGLPADSEEFRQTYADQLRRVVARLAEPR
jgi:TetR/AcrR family transcriptional regulator